MERYRTFRKRQRREHFAHGLNFYKLVWIFLLGCIMGFLIETAWLFVHTGILESRKGVIYGPFSPVYGFGAVLFTIFLYKLKKVNGIIIFTISAVLGALFEYACSWLQEHFMGTISWEYSNQPLNLYGRTSLKYSILWGALGYFFIKHVYPIIDLKIEKIPNSIGPTLTWVIFVFLTLDMGISLMAVKRQTERHNGIEAHNKIQEFLDEKYNDELLEKVYPNMIQVKKSLE